jgi:radical SAM superfamily enzyme YgiQ (UPF0313 family)
MNRIAALLVQPKTPQTFWSLDSAIRAAGFKALMPPLGLMTIASMLPPHYDVRIVDMNTTELTIADVEHADLVFLTGMWVHQESFIEVVRMCRQAGTTIVAGGPLVQSALGSTQVRKGLPDPVGPTLSALAQIDHLVLHEAEVNLPRFLADYAQGKAQRLYDDDARVDLSHTPSPRFDLIDPHDYASMSLQFSRGCPFNCEFCDIIQMFGRVPRTKTPAQFIEEMDALYATGYRGQLFVVDDNFIANRKVVKNLLREIVSWQRERKYPYLLFTEASVDLAADDELLLLMAQAGFTSVFLGIESSDPATLRAANKKQNLRGDLDESVRKIQNAGIEVMAGFILGFDTDSADVFDRQLDFIQRNGIAQSMVGLLAAMPNTDLYRRLEREGRLVAGGEHHTGDNVNAYLNFIPRMSADTLLAGYRRVLTETYSPANYFDRALTLISRLPDMRVSSLAGAEPWRRALARSRIKAANGPKPARIAVEMGRLVFSRWGVHALPFFVKSLAYGILALPLAIQLAFRGRHYASVARRVASVEVSNPPGREQLGSPRTRARWSAAAPPVLVTAAGPR